MDWIESFMDYTKGSGSPELFRKWAALAALAGAAERKLWIKTGRGILYPNLYAILVGPAGAGKSIVLKTVREFWLALDGHFVAPSSVTKASLIDALNTATRRIVRPKDNPAVIDFNSLKIASSELGVLLPGYDTEFMHVLTDLYDCDTYSETRRTGKLSIEIKAPQLNIIAACTPAYLTSVMPEGAWDQGFASRIIMAYSGESVFIDPFDEQIDDTAVRKTLIRELTNRAGLFGKMTFTEEAVALIRGWWAKDEAPRPDHPKLISYNSRRTAHLLKLSMLCSLSESSAMVIEDRHMRRALDFLLEVEFYMPDIFKSMANTSHGQLIQEAWHYVYKLYLKTGKQAVHRGRLVNFLQHRTPAHNVDRVVDVMVQSGLLRPQLEPTGPSFIPQGKEDLLG